MDTRECSRVPATLGIEPGSREAHALSYLAPADSPAVDSAEGRGSGWYRLVRLTAARRRDLLEVHGTVRSKPRSRSPCLSVPLVDLAGLVGAADGLPRVG